MESRWFRTVRYTRLFLFSMYSLNLFYYVVINIKNTVSMSVSAIMMVEIWPLRCYKVLHSFYHCYALRLCNRRLNYRICTAFRSQCNAFWSQRTAKGSKSDKIEILFRFFVDRNYELLLTRFVCSAAISQHYSFLYQSWLFMVNYF